MLYYYSYNNDVDLGQIVMDPSPYAEQRYKDGLEYARLATQHDKKGQFSAALSFYNEAVGALTHATSLAPVFTPILVQVGEYSRRSDEIRQYLTTSKRQGLYLAT